MNVREGMSEKSILSLLSTKVNFQNNSRKILSQKKTLSEAHI